MPAGLPTLLLVTMAAAAPAPTTAVTLAEKPASAEPAADCPSVGELANALNPLAPGLAPAAPTTSPLPRASGHRLAVSTTPASDVRVDLLDAQGEVVLHRVLPAPPRGRAPDCAALA